MNVLLRLKFIKAIKKLLGRAWREGNGCPDLLAS